MAVVRETLPDGMELEALHLVVVISLFAARTPLLAAMRVDAGEGDRDIAVLVRELGDLPPPRNPPPPPPRSDPCTGSCRIDGEDDEAHLGFAIHLPSILRHRPGSSLGSVVRPLASWQSVAFLPG